MDIPQLNYGKFKNLVHYVCYKADREDLGATKLNKTLWYSDLSRYLEVGNSITGETYVKLQFGPAPKHILKIVDDLVAEGKIAVRDASYFGYNKKEYVALKKPDLSVFSAAEISLVDDVIQEVCYNHTAKSISLKSHDDVWKVCEYGEEIPYYAALLRPEELTDDDLAWADESIARWEASCSC